MVHHRDVPVKQQSFRLGRNKLTKKSLSFYGLNEENYKLCRVNRQYLEQGGDYTDLLGYLYDHYLQYTILFPIQMLVMKTIFC